MNDAMYEVLLCGMLTVVKRMRARWLSPCPQPEMQERSQGLLSRHHARRPRALQVRVSATAREVRVSASANERVRVPVCVTW